MQLFDHLVKPIILIFQLVNILLWNIHYTELKRHFNRLAHIII